MTKLTQSFLICAVVFGAWGVLPAHATTQTAFTRGGEIKAGGIDTAKLATDSVTTAKILDGAVDTAKLATDSVTNAKVLKGSIDSTKLLGSTSINTGKLLCHKAAGGIGYCSAFTLSPSAWECDCN